MQTGANDSESTQEEEFLYLLTEGSDLLRAGQIKEARYHFERALALQEGNEQALNLLGLSQFRLGQFDDATRVFEGLIHDNPVEPSLRLNLAMVHLKTDRLDAAKACLTTVLDLNPDHPRAASYMGLALERLGELEEAAGWYDRAGNPERALQVRERLAAEPAPFDEPNAIDDVPSPPPEVERPPEAKSSVTAVDDAVDDAVGQSALNENSHGSEAAALTAARVETLNRSEVPPTEDQAVAARAASMGYTFDDPAKGRSTDVGDDDPLPEPPALVADDLGAESGAFEDEADEWTVAGSGGPEISFDDVPAPDLDLDLGADDLGADDLEADDLGADDLGADDLDSGNLESLELASAESAPDAAIATSSDEEVLAPSLATEARTTEAEPTEARVAEARVAEARATEARVAEARATEAMAVQAAPTTGARKETLRELMARSPKPSASGAAELTDFGVVALTIQEILYLRTDRMVGLTGELEVEPINRRYRGRRTDSLFGGNDKPMSAAMGFGMALLDAGEMEIATLRLDTEDLYLVERHLLAFTDGLVWENGRLPAEQGEDLDIVHLRGSGDVTLATERPPMCLEVRADRPVTLHAARLIGWNGQVVPFRGPFPGLPDSAKRPPIVRFEGSGLVLST